MDTKLDKKSKKTERLPGVRYVLKTIGYLSVRLADQNNWAIIGELGDQFGTTEDTDIVEPETTEKHAKLVNSDTEKVKGYARKSETPSEGSTIEVLRPKYREILRGFLDESHLGADEEITIVKRDENRDGKQVTVLTNRRGIVESIKSRLPDHEYDTCRVQLGGEMSFDVATAPFAYFSPLQGLCYGDNQVKRVAKERSGGPNGM